MLLILGCTLALLFQFVNTATPVELSSDFTATTFSSPSGWSVAFGNVGYQTENSKTLFGGVNNFDVSTQIQKIFILPPHYLIRIMVTIWTFGQWNNGEIKMLCDDKQIMSKKLYTMQNIYHKSPTIINVVNNHNANTAIISIRPQIQDQYTQSWGIRDFQIYYYPCPNGCQICSNTDTQTSDCNSWIQSYSQFTTNSIDKIHNEGWFINDDKINFTFEKCNGLTLFGYYNAGQILKRTFFLDAHDRIRIQFLLIKVNDWDKSVLQLLIDGVSQYQYSDKTDQLHNINYCDSNTGLDSIERIDLEFDHSEQLSEFIFQSTLSQQQLQNKFGIRDFTIFISCKNCQTSGIITFNPVPVTYLNDIGFTQSPFQKVTRQQDKARLYNCTNSAGANHSTILGLYSKDERINRVFQLIPHRSLKISTQLWLVDSYDAGEYLFVYIDGIQQAHYGKSTFNGPNYCNNVGYEDGNAEFSQIYENHSLDQVTISFDTSLNEPIENESFGIKNVQIELGDCPFFCTSCNNIPNDICQYVYWIEHKSLWGQVFEDGGGWGGSYSEVDSPIQSNLCSNGLYILGGYGSVQHQSLIKYDQTIPAHLKLRIIFNLYVIGNWNEKQIKITVNGQNFYEKNMKSTYSNLFCSSSNIKAFIIHFDKVIDHTYTNVQIRINNDIPLFPEDDLSYGIRDLQIYYESL